eukprot:1685770-Rhodomonas_salina.1
MVSVAAQTGLGGSSTERWRSNNRSKWNKCNAACRIRHRERDTDKDIDTDTQTQAGCIVLFASDRRRLRLTSGKESARAVISWSGVLEEGGWGEEPAARADPRQRRSLRDDSRSGAVRGHAPQQCGAGRCSAQVRLGVGGEGGVSRWSPCNRHRRRGAAQAGARGVLGVAMRPEGASFPSALSYLVLRSAGCLTLVHGARHGVGRGLNLAARARPRLRASGSASARPGPAFHLHSLEAWQYTVTERQARLRAPAGGDRVGATGRWSGLSLRLSSPLVDRDQPVCASVEREERGSSVGGSAGGRVLEHAHRVRPQLHVHLPPHRPRHHPSESDAAGLREEHG